VGKKKNVHHREESLRRRGEEGGGSGFQLDAKKGESNSAVYYLEEKKLKAFGRRGRNRPTSTLKGEKGRMLVSLTGPTKRWGSRTRHGPCNA